MCALHFQLTSISAHIFFQLTSTFTHRDDQPQHSSNPTIIRHAMTTISLPGPLFLTDLVNHGKENPQTWRDLAKAFASRLGRELASKEDFTRLLWVYLPDQAKQQLFRHLPAVKQAELAEIAKKYDEPDYKVNPYHKHRPHPAVEALLQRPDHSLDHFNTYLDNLPDLDALISLLADQKHLTDPIDQANIYETERALFEDCHHKVITSRHDKCALLYEALDDVHRAQFERKLIPSLRAQRSTRTNPYLLHTSLAENHDVFTTSESHPSLLTPPLDNEDLSGPDEILVAAPPRQKLLLLSMPKVKPTLPVLGDRVPGGKSLPPTSPPPNTANDSDSENDDGKTTGPVQHPPWQGVPGKPMSKPSKKNASYVPQERWKEWPLYDLWVDYKLGERPPASVRLDDWNLRHVCDYEEKETRVTQWPADFDRDGNIRRKRANYGYAAKQLNKDGLWQYLVFKSYYQLIGNEARGNTRSDVLTLVGGPDAIKGERHPYIRIGQNAIVQQYLGPYPPAQHPPSQQPSVQPFPEPDPTTPNVSLSRSVGTPGLPQSQSFASSPPSALDLITSANPATKRRSEDIREDYLRKRARGIIDSDSDSDVAAPVQTPDRAEAALRATEHLISGILHADKDLGARLKAERKAITKLQAMTTNLVEMARDLATLHQETVQMAAKQLCHLPQMAQEHLTDPDAARIARHATAEVNRLHAPLKPREQ